MDEYTLKDFDHPEDIHWNDLLTSLPGVHILQTSYWAEIKARVGWIAKYLVWEDKDGNIKAAALVLIKNLPLLGRLWNTCIIYIPRGPVLDWTNSNLATKVLRDLIEFGRRRHAIFLKIDPDLPIASGLPGSESYQPEVTGQNISLRNYWRKNGNIQLIRSNLKIRFCWISHCRETEILSRMKQKTRYNICLPDVKGSQSGRVILQISPPLSYVCPDCLQGWIYHS